MGLPKLLRLSTFSGFNTAAQQLRSAPDKEGVETNSAQVYIFRGRGAVAGELCPVQRRQRAPILDTLRPMRNVRVVLECQTQHSR